MSVDPRITSLKDIVEFKTLVNMMQENSPKSRGISASKTFSLGIKK
jgi:hypothetical protein